MRGALLLRELNGLSHEEIAVALETTVGGAKQSIFEAREALSELAEGRAMSCEDVRRRTSDGDRRVLRGRRVRAHLRDCAACERFAAAVPARRTELRAGCRGRAAEPLGLAHVLHRHAGAPARPAPWIGGAGVAAVRTARAHSSAATAAATAARPAPAARARATRLNTQGNPGHSAVVAGAVAGAQGVSVSASHRAAGANSSHGAASPATSNSSSASRHAAKGGGPSTKKQSPAVVHSGAPAKSHCSNAGVLSAVGLGTATYGRSLATPGSS